MAIYLHTTRGNELFSEGVWGGGQSTLELNNDRIFSQRVQCSRLFTFVENFKLECSTQTSKEM